MHLFGNRKGGGWQTIGTLENRGEGLAFTGERKKLGGLFCWVLISCAVAGQEKFFPPPAGVYKASFFLPGNTTYASYEKWQWIHTPHSRLPNSISMQFPLFMFTFPSFDQDLFLKRLLIKSQGFLIFSGFVPWCQKALSWLSCSTSEEQYLD